MKSKLKTTAAVIFIVLNSTSVFAALSEGISIETPNSGTESARVFDSILGNINHPELSGSTLNNFKHSSQPAAVLLEGSSIGQEVSLQYSGGGSRSTSQPAPQLPAGSAPDIFMYANRPAGYASSAYQYSSTSDLATSVSVRSINTQDSQLIDTGLPSVITGTVTATPLPAAGLLLASGLFTLPFFRNRRNEAI